MFSVCSAVAVNCCQFACCIPQNLMYSVTAPEEAADWMGALAKSAPSVKLRDLVVPGTHDSASYTIAGWKPFSAVGRTQNLGVADQLRSGARYLDLRYAGASRDPNKLSIWHGCLEGGDFQAILGEIKAFLDEHDKEFLVLELVPEFGRAITVEQKAIFLNLVKEVFGDKIYHGRDVQQLLQRVTLGDLLAEKKQVCILVHNRFYENYTTMTEEQITEEYGYVTSQKCMYNRWHNTRECNALLNCNLEEQDRCCDHLWLNNQFVLTPGFSGAADTLPTLLGKNSLQPLAMAENLYKPCVLDAYFREHADKHWNLVMLDYIDRCPLVIEYLIALNFPKKLTIHQAVVGPTDVTESAKAKVGRNRVLLLTNVASDLECEGGNLTLAYQLGGAYYVATLDFGCETTAIVSEFICRDLSTNVKLQRGTSGFVVGGQVHPDRPGGDGVAVEFKATDDGFEFPK